jgi:DnaJ-class molecular chaperone
MNYYDILGVNQQASPDDLKKAYKKLSMQHHPDRTGGDDSRFKQINEAYSTLKDPQKRQEYDNPQPQYPPGFGPGGFQGVNPGGFEDIFANMFGQGFAQQQRRPIRNKDIRINYRMNFTEVYTGIGTSISFSTPSGRHEVIDVKIPPGMKHNDVVQFPGYGDDSIQGVPRGVLQVKLDIATPPGWRREGEQLYTEVVIDVFDLILGKTVILNTPEKKQISLTIPPGTNNGVTMNIAHHGVPRVNTNNRGNLYVKIKANTPKLTNDEIRKIQEIKNGINLRTK